jgi:predicted XRE-type DNA-binding protein
MGSKRNSEVVVLSSGNVFADLELKDPDEKQTKVRLAFAVNQILRARRLSQVVAARMLGVNQPKISALANYKLDGFSVGRLMYFLNALDRDVEIVIHKKPRSHRDARIRVTSASAV